MTRAEIARKLLALGPLDLPEFIEITGWSYWVCVHALAALRRTGLVREIHRGNRYRPSRYEVTA